MSKKKDKKKSGKKLDKIELHEITAETAAAMMAAEEELRAAKADEAEAAKRQAVCKVKILPAPDGQTDKKYEETVAAALNVVAADGYELLSVTPSADPKKLVAFFRLSK